MSKRILAWNEKTMRNNGAHETAEAVRKGTETHYATRLGAEASVALVNLLQSKVTHY